MKQSVNLNAIGGYLVMKDFCNFIDKLIKNPNIDIKKLKKIRKERGIYLMHLKMEREEALKFIKKYNGKRKNEK